MLGPCSVFLSLQRITDPSELRPPWAACMAFVTLRHQPNSRHTDRRPCAAYAGSTHMQLAVNLDTVERRPGHPGPTTSCRLGGVQSRRGPWPCGSVSRTRCGRHRWGNESSPKWRADWTPSTSSEAKRPTIDCGRREPRNVTALLLRPSSNNTFIFRPRTLSTRTHCNICYVEVRWTFRDLAMIINT